MYSPPQQLVDQLKRHEALHLTAYLCPAGKITIGYGHNLEANPIPGIPASLSTTITADQADRLLIADIIDYRQRLLARFPWTVDTDPVRFCVLVNMAFNMGLAGLAGFHDTLAHVAADEWAEASAGMLASRWAYQVGDYAPDSPRGIKNARPGRAWELARQMRTGEWWEV